MKSTSTYYWNNHSIKVIARASAKKLWLDYKFDVYVDNEPCYESTSSSWLSSTTRFKIKHEEAHTYGQVISSGFPCTPIITQATILNNSIIGHNQMWVKNRLFTYTLVAGCLLALL